MIAVIVAVVCAGLTIPTRGDAVTKSDPPVESGYRLAGQDGSVYAIGATYAGSAAGMPLAGTIVGIASTPHFGYWLVAADGGVFGYGDAHF